MYKAEGQYILEKKMLQITCYIYFALALISTFAQILFKKDIKLVIVSGIIALLVMLIYLLLYRKSFFLATKIIITSTSFAAANLIWLWDNEKTGYYLILFLLITAYVVIIWGKKYCLCIVGLVILNCIILSLLDYYSDPGNPNNQLYSSHILKLSFGIILLIITFYIYISSVKNNYLIHYSKAIESDKLKSLFLRNISHEIRTPLNAINGFAELISLPGIPDQDKIQYSSIIKQNAKILTNLINNILDVTNIESNQLIVTYSRFNVVSLISRIVKEADSALEILGKQNLKINFNTSTFEMYIQSDEIRIEQIVNNLLENAIKFTKTGTIDISISKADEKFFFYISDTGIGIAEDHYEDIFKRFFKVVDGSPVYFSGDGLGLYIVKELLEILKGEISVKSKLGEGSEFTFWIPDLTK